MNWELEERALVIMNATKREREIYYARMYGNKPYITIGSIYGIRVEKVRQICMEQLRRLRHPLALEFINKGYDYSVGQAINEAWNKGFNQYNLDNNTLMLVDLDLSIRSFNALKRAGYQNIVDIPLDIDKLSKIRHIGKKSAQEIVQKVKEYLGKED